jgi:hypothetical protein
VKPPAQGLAGVVNAFTALHPRARYLEVGVWAGDTFLAVEAGRKVAVDIDFKLDLEAARREQPHTAFHRMPSDAYFGGPGAGEVFDVILLDGLHTFEQTLRDLLNAAERLQHRGVIIIDDLLPTDELAALPSLDELQRRRDAGEPWRGHWMGDVYRLGVFVDSFMPSWTWRAVGGEMGQLVMWRQPRASVTERRVEAVAQLSFAELMTEPRLFQPVSLEQAQAEAAAALQLGIKAPWTGARVAAGLRRRLLPLVRAR